MKKTNKIIVALLIILTIVTISVSSFAGSSAGVLLNELNGNGNDIATGRLTDFGNNIIAVVQVVGVIVAVIILLVLGIKYMMGSAEEKADYKKSMIPYIIGAILIFAGTSIVRIVYDLTNSLTKVG